MTAPRGIAPGAAAWKWLLAEERDRTDDLVAEVERLRDELAAYKADDDESIALQVAQIARLSAEVERLRAAFKAQTDARNGYAAEAERLRAEVERLRHERANSDDGLRRRGEP